MSSESGVDDMTLDVGQQRRLQLVQGLQWLRAAHGDPFAALLRGHDEDVDALNARLLLGEGIRRSETGTWVVARYRTAAAMLADPAFEARFADWRPGGIPVMPLTERDLGLAPERRAAPGGRARSAAVAHALARRQSQLAAGVERALDGLAGQVDLAPVAARISVEVLAELLELPAVQRDRLAERQPFAGLATDSLLCPQGIVPTRRMLQAIADLRELFGGQPLRLVLAVVGVRVCTDLLLNALLELLASPAEWAALRADPASAPGVVEETLRHSPPVRVQLMVARTDTEVEGQAIQAGHQVAILLGSANRDPAVFAEPDRFRPGRKVAPDRVALLPSCPGELFLPLARAQAAVALTALVTRFPGLTMSGAPLRRPKAPATRGVLRLPVRTF
nr:Arm32 [uncultured bacterium]